MKIKKEKDPLFDCLGRELAVGVPVAFYHRRQGCMKTGRIKRITRVNVTITWETQGGTSISRSIRASDTVILDEESYVFHVLRSSV